MRNLKEKSLKNFLVLLGTAGIIFMEGQNMESQNMKSQYV
jgi:hypothetical protein